MSTINARKAMIKAASDFLTAFQAIDTAGGPVEDLPTIPADAIAWENVLYAPAGKELWASVYYIPNIPEGRTVGVCGSDDLTGLIQIDLNVAPDSGDAALMDWEEKARLFFPSGFAFIEGGQSALVIYCGMSQGRIVENYYRKSLSVGFRSQINRTVRS